MITNVKYKCVSLLGVELESKLHSSKKYVMLFRTRD